MQTPVEKGCMIGEVSILMGDEVLLSRKILLKESVQKKQVSDYMIEMIKEYGRYLLESVNHK
ncbi:MAG: hypothetical protein J6A04_05695 [Clostridia bacterium]|nr:hypothetical protein [Clostridia bacterium]